MENLAPAGDRASLERAAAAGADAVYLGYSAFSARAGAGNFDGQQLRDAVRYAHLHHIHVHVTVNTLVKDGELEDVYHVLALLRDVGADAVLIQDAGILKMCRTCFPDLTVHASTQMGIHNACGVRFCGGLGVRRVVLARECSLEEIRRCADTGVEIEVFGHGAQCVSVSGMCLFSSMLGERSGNRGRCAQPCRLRYSYGGKTGAFLSPRDVCLRDDLKRLADAGAVSVKLEGRLKRPEYVAVVTESYRKGLDTGLAADEKEKKALRQIFSRGGFMNGYAMGCEDAGVIDPDRVNHGGIPMGTLTGAARGFASLIPAEDLSDGDGLQIRSDRGDEELIYSGPFVPAGGNARIRLREGMNVSAGDCVYRLTSSEQLKHACELKTAPIPVDMELTAVAGQPLALTLTDGVSTVVYTGDVTAEARQRTATPEEIRRSLEKTGDTPFVLRDLRIETRNAFLPVSVLNAARRDGLKLLEERRILDFSPERKPLPDVSWRELLPEDRADPWHGIGETGVPELLILREPEDLRDPAIEKLAAGKLVALYPEDWRENALRSVLDNWPEKAWLCLPSVCEEDTLNMIRRLCGEYRDRLGGVILGSIGQLGVEWPVPAGAGPEIPVMNRLAASMLLENGCVFVTADRELTAGETGRLCRGLPVLTPCWGRTRLMLLHHCPARTILGLTSGHSACTMCDRRDEHALRGTAMKDRKGAAFPLRRLRLPEGCLTELMNSAVTDLTAETAGRPRILDLTDRELPGDDLPRTRGHWQRPVE